MTEENKTQKVARSLRGRVVSDKMQKACVVAVDRRVTHPVYGKIVTRTTKFHVQDPENTAKVGDIVIGYEANPVKKVVAIGRISQASDGSAIYIEKTEGLSNPIEYSDLKGAAELEKMYLKIQWNN